MKTQAEVEKRLDVLLRGKAGEYVNKDGSPDFDDYDEAYMHALEWKRRCKKCTSP